MLCIPFTLVKSISQWTAARDAAGRCSFPSSSWERAMMEIDGGTARAYPAPYGLCTAAPKCAHQPDAFLGSRASPARFPAIAALYLPTIHIMMLPPPGGSVNRPSWQRAHERARAHSTSTCALGTVFRAIGRKCYCTWNGIGHVRRPIRASRAEAPASVPACPAVREEIPRGSF